MHDPALFWKKNLPKLILGLIIVFYLVNGIIYLRSQSITADEGSFMNYAIRYLKGHPERITPVTDNSKMPASAINMLPRIVENVGTGGSNEKTDWGYQDTMMGRYVTLAVSILVILLVYTWSKQLYGNKAGLFAAFLMSFCPNNIANAGLVTTDSYAVLFLLLSSFYLWKFCRVRTTRYFILFSVSVALSQLVKQSLFHLYVLAPLCLALYFAVYREKFNTGLFFRRLLIFAVISVVIINVGYYFYESFESIGNYHFMSNLFQGLQQSLPQALPLPFPKPFVDGLDMAKYYDQVGGGKVGVSSFGKPTILGQARTGGQFWYYYIVSILYKTPLAYFIFFFGSAGWMIRNMSLKRFMANEFFLLAPVVYYLVVLSFFYKTQCGLRHIIFIYPFLFIFSSAIIAHVRKRYWRIAIVVLSLFLMASVLRYWGNYYPYTNELILDKKKAYLKVGAANLEFHQGYYFATDYMAKHPGVDWASRQPKPGLFIITTQDYLDVWNQHTYDWLLKFKPIDQVAYNYLLIEVKESDIK